MQNKVCICFNNAVNVINSECIYRLSSRDYITIRMLMIAEVEESSPDQTEKVRPIRPCDTRFVGRQSSGIYTGVSLSTSRLDNGPLHWQRRWRRHYSEKEGKVVL